MQIPYKTSSRTYPFHMNVNCFQGNIEFVQTFYTTLHSTRRSCKHYLRDIEFLSLAQDPALPVNLFHINVISASFVCFANYELPTRPHNDTNSIRKCFEHKQFMINSKSFDTQTHTSAPLVCYFEPSRHILQSGCEAECVFPEDGGAGRPAGPIDLNISKL